MTATPSHFRRPNVWAPWASLVSLAVTVLVTAVLFAVGAWRRRWMSDDGMIVLRTVRNLLAGNGPVFNAGERVETNTSTLWQYLIYVGAKLTDARLEVIAMWLALVLSVAALTIATAATGMMWRRVRTGAGRAQLILPFGALIYLSLPPARDFATSGLEWGLSIFWLGVLWALLQWWVQTRAEERAGAATWVLAFWVGLSWLVRPELVLYGALFGLVLLIGVRNWTLRAMVLLVAVPVPLAYQIFRMGYYGLLTPHTAVAKSASDAMWGTGWDYVTDLMNPYAVWFGFAMVLIVTGLALGFGPQPFVARGMARSFTVRSAKWRQETARSIAVVTSVMVIAALLHCIYVIRVGGDFMHGRMVLLPLFALLLPVMCLPVFDLRPDRVLSHWPVALLSLAGFVGLVCWSWMIVEGGSKGRVPEELGTGNNVVDERAFYAKHTGVERPLYADDFAQFVRMDGFTEGIVKFEQDGDVGMMVPIMKGKDAAGEPLYGWLALPRNKYVSGPPTTVWFTNLGMTSANAPLNVRVLDQIGLSNPLAARTERIPDGRIGHDKNLPVEWGVSDSPSYGIRLPRYMDKDLLAKAAHAQKTEELQRLVATYREPMSVSRFFSNIKFALTEGRTMTIDATGEKYASMPEVSEPIHWPDDVKLDKPR